jgi:2-oxoglutarate ferredoxin oxidoreductase subunit delta
MAKVVFEQKVDVVTRFCKGCGICVDFCPMKVLEMSNATKSIPILKNEEKCTKCGVCEIMCPDFAIFVVK